MIVAASFEPFALWLAEHERPEWRIKPLVSVQRDRVVGLSPAAKRAGLRLGMSLAGARQQAPELEVVEADGPHLQAAWESLVLEASAVSLRFEPLRVGVLAFEGEKLDARQFAAAYRVRVGVSSSLERAQLLAVSSYAGRTREGGNANEADLLMRMPLRLLRGLGLGEKALTRLRWLGIERVGQLLTWPRSQLLAFLGAEGEGVARALFGPFRNHLQRFTPPPRVSATLSFDKPACEPAQLIPALAHLVAETVRALGDRAASLVTVKAEAAGIRSGATRRAKEPLNDARRLLEPALLALADTKAAALGIDGLTLELGGLRRGGVQEGLWRQREELRAAITAVSERFPTGLLRLVEVDAYAFEPERRFELRRVHTGEPVPWREVSGAPEQLEGERASAARQRAAAAASAS
jgi:protein ImuB